MAVSSVGSFRDVVVRSGLVPAELLDQLCAEFTGSLGRRAVTGGTAAPLPPAEGGECDAAALAEHFVQRGILTRYQADRLLEGQSQGLVLGDYRILEPVGGGGMGQVFRAEHVRMKRDVALKLLAPGLQLDAAVQARFQREMELAARLEHENIVRAYDVREHDGILFLVMELVLGLDLGRVIAHLGRVPPPWAADLIAQAACGLDHAFRCGVTHRDIKPPNLMVTFAGVVKLLDLGLARAADLRRSSGSGSEFLTQPNAVFGTPDYLSPEQARDSHKADIRSDIYSLGATLYHLLAGQPPFPGGNVASKLLRLLDQEPAPLERLVPGLPAGLGDVVRTMMAKRPEDRYATPADVVEGLAPFRVAPGAALLDAALRAAVSGRREGALSAEVGGGSHSAVKTSGVHGAATEASPYGPRQALGLSSESARAREEDVEREARSARGRASGATPLSAAVPRGNIEEYLPVDRFFGREQDLVELAELLDEYRVITLVGAGGLGKTRTSLELARRVQDRFPHGVWFIPLETLRQGSLVAQEVQDRLGLEPGPGGDQASAAVRIAQALADRRALLILDNCEQLLGDGGRDFIALLRTLVRGCPELRIVVTSRHALEFGSAEYPWVVSPLAVPASERSDFETAQSCPAVELLCDRLKRRSGGRFELQPQTWGYVVKIARALDGVPLFLELAAGQLGRRTLPQIAGDVYRMLQSRDRTVPGRQRDLYQLLDWSYALLDDERDFFLRLGVFVGGFDAPDAGEITETPEALELLDALVEKHLVETDAAENPTAERPRYRLLAAVANYCREKLGDELPPFQRRHAEHYGRRLRQAAAKLSGPQQIHARAEFRRERENMLAALAWWLAVENGAGGVNGDAAEPALGKGDSATQQDVAELLCAAAMFLHGESRFHEMREVFAPVLSGSPLSEPVRAAAEYGRGLAFDGLSLWTEARAALERSREIWERLGRLDMAVRCLEVLGHGARSVDIHQAESYWTRGLELARQSASPVLVAKLLDWMGYLQWHRGDYGAAAKYLEEAIAIARRQEDSETIQNCLITMGLVHSNQGQYEHARNEFLEALEIRRRMGMKPGNVPNNIATTYIHQGMFDEARRHLKEGLRAQTEVGNLSGVAICLFNLGYIAIARGEYAEATGYIERAMEAGQRMGNRERIADCHEALARIAAGRKQFAKARELLAKAIEMSRSLESRADMVRNMLTAATIDLAEGLHADALVHLAEGLKLAEESSGAAFRAELLSLLAECHVTIGNWRQARELLDDSLRTFMASGMRLEVARGLARYSRLIAGEHAALAGGGQTPVSTRGGGHGGDLSAAVLAGAAALHVFRQAGMMRSPEAAALDAHMQELAEKVPADVIERWSEQAAQLSLEEIARRIVDGSASR